MFEVYECDTDGKTGSFLDHGFSPDKVQSKVVRLPRAVLALFIHDASQWEKEERQKLN